jgi:signal transduction histidine kinase
LGQLAGSVSHELRNPLGVISNAIYFLKAAQPDASMKVKEYLDIIEKETFTSDKIVTDLLDFTRIKSVDRQSITVPDLIRQVLDRYPAPLPVEVALDLPTGLPAVYVDQRQIIQVLGNLVDNACQSMMSSSSQEQAEPTWAPKSKKLTISAVEQTDMICINIIDTGTGISPENMDNLFEPLFSTKTKGIGLGLAISKKLAEANGGRIEVQSKPGTGSTFSLYLPVNNSKVVPAPAQDKDLK